jgi:hypothetical protein
LNGHEDGVGGQEGVESEEVEGGWAIDEDEVVIVADVGDTFAQAKFAVIESNELKVSADEVLIGGDEAETLEISGDDGFFGWNVAEEDVIEAGMGRVFGDAEASGGVALGVGVDDQDAEVVGREGSGQIDGGSGLSNSAFLISDGENSAQAAIVTWQGFGVEGNENYSGLGG